MKNEAARKFEERLKVSINHKEVLDKYNAKKNKFNTEAETKGQRERVRDKARSFEKVSSGKSNSKVSNNVGKSNYQGESQNGNTAGAKQNNDKGISR